jgi:hypothetical protein
MDQRVEEDKVGSSKPDPAVSAEQARAPGSLALLALLTSAVVVMTRGSDYFNLWDSMIGLIIVLVAAAYKHEVGVDRVYRAAFSLIVGAGLMLIVGPLAESVLYHVQPVIEYDGPLLQTPDKMMYDAVFVGVWGVFAATVYVMLARQQKG